jgi:hypothetical protein
VPPICKTVQILKKAAALGKQTVERDFEKTLEGECLAYSHYEFTEFLEIIARVADLISMATPMEDQRLHVKIEAFLVQILKIADPTAQLQSYRKAEIELLEQQRGEAEEVESYTFGDDTPTEVGHDAPSEVDYRRYKDLLVDQGTGIDGLGALTKRARKHPHLDHSRTRCAD